MVTTQNTRIQEYINDVCSQIKLREVHQEIKLELKTHLQEIVDEYLSNGFSENEAVSKAIAQMGSADIVGKQLNKVHKPKPEWSILTLSLLFVSIGLLAMYFIEKEGLFTAVPIPIFTKSLVFTIIGAVIATGLYLSDYRKMEPYSKHIYLGTALLLAIAIITGQRINGKLYLSMGLIYFDIAEIIPLLFSLALAGTLNKWVWNEPKKLLQGLFLCVVPLALILASCSLSTGVIYSITCITLMIVSGARYRYSFLLTGLLSGIISLPFISTPYGLKGLTVKPQFMPNLHTDFIFSYITHTFGWIAGGVLAALIVIFIIRIMRIATTVKNNYAKLLISGFVAILAVQFLWNILMNLGFAPLSGVSLPFISYGGSQLIFNAAALGVISSIYRRRNISKTLINR